MMRLVARSWEMKNHSDAWRTGTSTLDVKALHKTPIGGYMIGVMGTCGSLSHSVTITVNVTA